MAQKLDTRAMGLDIGLAFTKWLTGAENLHYGYWDGLEPSAANVRAAQEAYTERLFALLPEGPLRILDIGGGAGETARKLLALGHSVEIVVPSEFLAERCRANAPEARTHETTFEAFSGAGPFDVCLFSESFQYIPLTVSLSKAAALLAPGGRIVLADCFRSESFKGSRKATVGGGHNVTRFREVLAESGLATLSEEDITTSVAPSVDVEQGFYHVLGYAVDRISTEMQAKRPRLHWMLSKALRVMLTERRRLRLNQRLRENTRTAEVFAANNRYLMMSLAPQPAPQ